MAELTSTQRKSLALQMIDDVTVKEFVEKSLGVLYDNLFEDDAYLLKELSEDLGCTYREIFDYFYSLEYVEDSTDLEVWREYLNDED